MTLASLLVASSADGGEIILLLLPFLLADTVQGLYWRWWISGHSTTGVSDLDPQHGDGQFVPLVDLSQGLLAGSSGLLRLGLR